MEKLFLKGGNMDNGTVLKWIGRIATAGGIVAGLVSNWVSEQDRKKTIADEVSKQLSEQLKIVDKAGES